MKKITFLTSRNFFFLFSSIIILISEQLLAQNKSSVQESLPVPSINYPDGPARDPKAFPVSVNTHTMYAPAGSIAVNENATYNNYTPTQLVQNILVTGCLKASNVTFTGLFNTSDATKRQLGYFNKANSSFPLDEGLIIATGYVSEAEGPNNSPSVGADLKEAGDADLTTIAGYATHDAANLQFDFVPAGNTVEFQYIFASEEYLEWCCTQYNDVFGFFLSGPGISGPYSNNSINLAVLPNTTPPVPITINSIHQYVASNHNGNACPAQNAQYYVDNPSGSLVMQYDGSTVTMTISYPVVACQTYHIKLKIADVSDGLYSSAVFLKARSFTSEPITIRNNNPVYGTGSFNNIFEGCTPDHLIFSRPLANTGDAYTVNLQYSGTAINGVDVKTLTGNPLPAQITIPIGDTSYSIDYYAVNEGTPYPGKVLTVGTLQGCPCDTGSSYLLDNIYIWGNVHINSVAPSNILCNGVANGAISINASGGSGNYQYSLNGTTWQTSNLFTNLSQGTYTVYVKDPGNCNGIVSQGNVVIGSPTVIHANAGPDVTICSGNSTQLFGSGGVNYSWSPGLGLSATNIANPIASPTTTTNYILTVTDANNLCTSKDSVIVNILPSPVATITPGGANICAGSSITLTATGGGTYLWNPGGNTTASITITPVTNSSYTVLVTSANGCTAVATSNIFIYPAPQTFTVTGGGMICPGNGIAIGLSGSVTGNTYQLKLGATNVGSPVSGTGSAISFGSISSAGTYTVVATDPAHGCNSQMTGNAVIYLDNIPPSITCPGNLSANVTPGSCSSTVINSDPVKSDNCAVTLLTWTMTGATVANSPLTGINTVGSHLFNTGTTIVTYTVKDAAGNSNTCSYNVVITDNILPVITCPSNVSVNNDAGKCYATLTLATPVTSDNCGVASVTNNAPSTYPVGTTTVIWTVTDIHGNTNTCQQTVTVTDNELPSITCPANKSVNNDAGKCYATVSLGAPITYDNCGVATVTNNAPATFPVGTTIVTWTVTDIHGNSKTCQQTVTVTDNELPTIICPTNKSVSNDPGKCYATVTLGTPTTNDNCGVATVTNNAPATFPVGTTLVTWTVTDIHGNTNTCQQTVVVTDNEHPTITCPGNVSVNNDPSKCYATVSLGTPVTGDNCGVATVTNNAPATFPVGTTIVTWTVTDIHGNSTNCNQTVNVTDNEPPTITCPATISVNNDPGKCYATVTLGTPVTNDNCGVGTVTNNAPSTFPIGTTIVNWIVTDIHGNSSNCQQTVNVTDIEHPTITCSANISVNNDPGHCYSTVSLIPPVTNDNCGILSVTNNAPVNFPVGLTTVTWTATDIHGNTSTCQQTVTVTDNELPTITCPANISTTNDAGQCYASVSLGTPTTNDNCGVATVTNNAPAHFPVGLTTVTWTVTDIHGNSNTCQQTVTVTDNELPTITCPNNISTTNDAGHCYATVALGTPVTNDNCGIATVTSNAPSTFPVGTTTVTWTVTDIHGNSNTCQQIIVVTDNEHPTISCPSNVSVNNDPGHCYATVTLGTPVTNDNCGVATVTNNAPSTFPVGTTTVTWTVTDIHGNSFTCQQSVTVTDNENPTITCPSNVSVNNDPGHCFAIVSLATPTTSDNCGVASVTNNAPSTFPIGATIVTWTVTDIHGNSSTCQQTVTVTDNELPSIICPSNITTTNDAGYCYASVYLGSYSASDNCGVASVTNDAPAHFPVGTTIITWTVTDIHGNTNTCQQTVVVTDDEVPTIECPGNLYVTTDPGNCFATVTLGTPVTNDNCGVATVTNNAPAQFPVGTTIVIWTVTDIHGNTNTCQQTVVVTDNQPPSIVCPPNITTNNDPGKCYATVTLGTPVTNDNCGIVNVTNDAPPTFLVGTTIVTWTATNIHGNSITCQQTVVVTDNELPTITCPADIAVNNDPGQCFATVTLGTPVTADNCGIATVTNNAPATFPIGSTTITWTVTDIHGNSNTCQQNVVVTDNELPTITCPADISVNNDPGQCFATVSLGSPVTNDNCGVASVTNNAPATFPVGTTTVIWTVNDIHGNSNTCQQTVVVTDNELPSITCPANISVNNDPGHCYATVTLGTPVTNDNCGVATVTNNAPVTFPVGSTTVIWTVTDIHGNSNTCQQTVVVTDNELPTITCPADIAVNNDPGQCYATVALGTAITNDNCGVATVTNNAPATFPVGSTTVTWTITDIHGNSNTCQQTVVVTDNELPTITCPADIAVNNDPGQCYATVALGTPLTNDNCGVASVTNNAPATFPVGTTTVVWTINDIHGNSNTCQQTVTVTDNELPTIICPADIAVNNDPGQCYATVALGTPVTGDNCGVATVTNNAPSTFPVGSTTVIWTVTDIHGNSNTCQQTVVVTDNELPTITCPADIAVNNDPGQCYATVSLGSPVTADNCGVATVTNNAPATFPVGSTTVTWTITDIHGNSNTCQQTVVVTDNELPSITCPANISVNNDPGQCFATVSLGSPVTSDNCGVASVTNNAPATFPVGTTTVIWTVNDIHGNSNTCQQTVTVTDNELPTIICHADTAVNNDPGHCYATLALIAPVTGDNCGVATVTNNAPPTFPVGTTQVVWTVTDIHGNSNTCQQTVVVTDNELPTITCPADTTVNADAGQCFATLTLSSPLTSDNCGVATVTNNAPSTFIVGTTTVIWTVTDIHGNENSCMQQITVIDNQPPTITCPADINTVNDPGLCSAVVNLGVPVTNDNCGVATIYNNAPAAFPVGTTLVTWWVTDVHSNFTTCNQSVTVVDNEPPKIVLQPVISLNNDPGKCYATFVLPLPVVTDNCGVDSLTNNAPATYPVGTTYVTWTATDIHGNVSTAQQTINVTDAELPTIVCSGNISVMNDPGQCSASVVLNSPVTSDNCGVETVINNAPASFPVGITTVTWTVTDIHGNTATCEQMVTVSDNEKPVVTCNGNININNDPGKCYASMVLPFPLVTDNCGVATITSDAPATFPIGSTTVNWTVTDIHGNISTCSQSVTVTDIEKPTLTCPATIYAHTDRGSDFATVDLGLPQTDDNCGIATTSNDAPAKFQIGTTIVTWTVTDIHGNSESCTQDVNVAPVIPIAIDDFDTTHMDVPLAINFLANDQNPGGNGLNTTFCGGPDHGTMRMEGDSLLVYTPNDGYKGIDQIRYTLYDPMLKALSDTAIIHILVGDEIQIVVHNVITPNGDGLNDTWVISGIENYPDNDVQIFNRWGDIIRHFTGYDNKTVYWDGTNKQGNPVPDGTYFYYINVAKIGKLNGWIFVRGNSK
jgi:gliding motility-associated-like protein